MTKLLDEAIEKVRALPDSEQDHAAATLLALAALAEQDGVYKLSAEERAAIDEGLAQADRGEFASDERVAAMWKKLGA
jgi:predicted transcriptional regulator